MLSLSCPGSCSVAAFCVGGGWSWYLTLILQREPSGKEGAEASLGARSQRTKGLASTH